MIWLVDQWFLLEFLGLGFDMISPTPIRSLGRSADYHCSVVRTRELYV